MRIFRTWICALTILGCMSCGDDDYAPSRPDGYSGIIEQGSSTQLSELVFTLDLVFEDSLYLLTDSLFSVELYLNDREWGKFTSTIVNPETFKSTEIESSLFTESSVRYLFVTNDQSGISSLETAGDYSIALRDLLTIQPGDYVAEIRYISWLNTDGQVVRRPVRDLIPFTLDEGTQSLFLGSFISPITL